MKNEKLKVKNKNYYLQGETAKKACKIIANGIPQKFLPTFHQTHPVKLNWDRWKVKMLSDAIRDGKGVGKDYIDDKHNYGDKDPKYLSYYIAQKILTEALKETEGDNIEDRK